MPEAVRGPHPAEAAHPPPRGGSDTSAVKVQDLPTHKGPARSQVSTARAGRAARHGRRRNAVDSDRQAPGRSPGRRRAASHEQDWRADGERGWGGGRSARGAGVRVAAPGSAPRPLRLLPCEPRTRITSSCQRGDLGGGDELAAVSFPLSLY